MHHLSTVARSQSQPAFRRTVATISRTRQNPQLTALRRVLGRYWAVTERNIRARCGLLIVERAVDRLHRVLSAFCAFRAFGRESVQAERLGRCAVPMVGRRSTVRFRKGAPVLTGQRHFSILISIVRNGVDRFVDRRRVRAGTSPPDQQLLRVTKLAAAAVS